MRSTVSEPTPYSVLIVRAISAGVATTGSMRRFSTKRISSSSCAFKGSLNATTIAPLRSEMGAKL